MEKSEKGGTGRVLLRVLQGALVGLGAVLPGISGGVLCVVFGVYQPVMEVLSDPVHALKKHIRLLLPLGVGLVLGFLGIARLLGFLLNRYPDPSVCLFVGLIAGMLPSLLREAGEQGRNRASYVALCAAFVVLLGVLLSLRFVSLQIVAGFGAYLFCGFCLALSVIVPGMSFSTLLMPLGLYTPFIDGIGRFDLAGLIPGGIGAGLTILLLARAVTHLMERHYSVLFHAIIGVVVAATVVIVPYGAFASGGALVNGVCLVAGAAAALLLDELGKRVR